MNLLPNLGKLQVIAVFPDRGVKQICAATSIRLKPGRPVADATSVQVKHNMEELEVVSYVDDCGDSSPELQYDEGREAELKSVITLLVINRCENKAQLSRYFLEMHELLVCAGRGGQFTAFIEGLPLGSPSRTTIYRWIDEERNRTARYDSSDYGVDDVEDDELNEEMEAAEGESEGADKAGDSKPDHNALPHAKNFTLRLPAETHKVFTARVNALLELRGEDANRATLFLELVTAAYEAEFTAVAS
jgi:hypothetical protein